jgi:hypothetical protein
MERGEPLGPRRIPGRQQVADDVRSGRGAVAPPELRAVLERIGDEVRDAADVGELVRIRAAGPRLDVADSVVPASVPSLVQSSMPVSGRNAWKKSFPPTLVR